MDAMLRDFLVTGLGAFSVISYVHPPDGALALLRYVRDPEGDRIRWATGERYRKVDFEESFEILERERPGYVREVRGDFPDQVVPWEDVKEHLRPTDRLEDIATEGPSDELEELALDVVEELSEDSGVPFSRFGVTGSLLLGVHDPSSSDLDLVVVGTEEFLAVRDVVLRIQEVGESRTGNLRPLTLDEWRFVYERRKPELDFETFVRHEMRKGNRIVAGDRVCDVLLVRDSSEVKEEKLERFKTLGRAELVCRILDDSRAFDYPAVWEVEVLEASEDRWYEIREIRSYSHTYVGQAFRDEVVEVRCKVDRSLETGEPVGIVGSTREARGEWIRVVKDDYLPPLPG